jgi:(heptosyl)LPS beta-1,4-glucosyltransferase
MSANGAPSLGVSTPTLGVVAICRNEERDLPGLLSNVLPWVDELVLVDDGSTDRTLELAAAAGARVRVVHRRLEPEGGFAAQRNAGIDAATADWLLHMDVDERVSPQLKAELLPAIARPAFDAYRYHRLNFFLHRPMRHGGLQRWHAAQLARRGLHRFERPIHEQCVISAEPARIGTLAGLMWHLNDEDFFERLRKNAQYAETEAARILGRGKRVRWHDLLTRPAQRAVLGYLLDQGFRDGVPGLIWAMHTFAGTFNYWAAAWDLQQRIPRESLEALLEGGQPAPSARAPAGEAEPAA